MSFKPEIVERKQLTMNACRLGDWFTNELFEDITEDGRERERSEQMEKKNKP